MRLILGRNVPCGQGKKLPWGDRKKVGLQKTGEGPVGTMAPVLVTTYGEKGVPPGARHREEKFRLLSKGARVDQGPVTGSGSKKK